MSIETLLQFRENGIAKEKQTTMQSLSSAMDESCGI